MNGRTENNVNFEEKGVQQQEKEEQNKENLPPLKQLTKTFHFTPSASDDCSMNSYRSSHIHTTLFNLYPITPLCIYSL